MHLPEPSLELLIPLYLGFVLACIIVFIVLMWDRYQFDKQYDGE